MVAVPVPLLVTVIGRLILAPVVRSATAFAPVLLSPRVIVALPNVPLPVLTVPLLITKFAKVQAVGEKVKVPVPVLTILPVAPVTTPAKAAGLVLAPPTVNVAEPSDRLPPRLPPPAREPIELLKLLRSSKTPVELFNVTAELFPKAEVLPARTVPLVTFRGPVNVFDPDSTIVPEGLVPTTADELSTP